VRLALILLAVILTLPRSTLAGVVPDCNDAPAPDPVDFLHRICTDVDFLRVSAVSSSAGPVDRFLKFTTPASDNPTLAPTVFQNTQIWKLHREFLGSNFSDFFPALTPETFEALFELKASRKYYVSVISRLKTVDGPVHGFNVVADFDDPAERLSLEDVAGIYNRLRAVFGPEPLQFFPDDDTTAEIAAQWQDPSFDIFFGRSVPPEVTFIPYTRSVGYGTVRVLTLEQFELLNQNGSFSLQDIVVVDGAPRDIFGIVSGLITAEFQGELSHLFVRTSRRETPNAFVRDALDGFGQSNGQLVRIEVAETGYSVTPATLEEAQEFWESVRPTISVQPTIDETYRVLADFDEINALEAAGAADPIEARFGGKAANLARLQAILTGKWEKYRENGFAVPMGTASSSCGRTPSSLSTASPSPTRSSSSSCSRTRSSCRIPPFGTRNSRFSEPRWSPWAASTRRSFRTSLRVFARCSNHPTMYACGIDHHRCRRCARVQRCGPLRVDVRLPRRHARR
jgi:hypothetical protein